MRDYIKLVEQAEIVEKKAKPPSKFKPTHFHLSNLSGLFGEKNAHTKLMYHDGQFWHMKRDENTGKRKLAKWNGNPNNRSKMNPAIKSLNASCKPRPIPTNTAAEPNNKFVKGISNA